MCDLSQGDLHFKRGTKENFASPQVIVITDRTSRICREVFEGHIVICMKNNLKAVLLLN